jgi:hypothetical protein
VGPDFVAALRADLVRAAIRQHRRRRARRAWALRAAAVVILAVSGEALLGAVTPSPASADVQIEVVDGRVAVTLEDLEHRPDLIEAAIRSTGLDVRVIAVPVGPSGVGRFIGDASSGDEPDELVALDAGRGSFAGFSVPLGWAGRLELRVGRPARGDEPYAAFADALAPGEPLACRPLIGRPAAQVADDLAESSLDVVFEAGEGPGLELLAAGRVAGSRYARWPVAGVDATSHHRVVVRLRPGPPPSSPPAC